MRKNACIYICDILTPKMDVLTRRMTIFQISIFFLLSISRSYASINSHNSKMSSRHYKDYTDPEVCMLEGVCQPVRNATCFGTTLPYAYTSVALAEDSVSHFEVQDNLALWQGLRSVPRCWAVVQPLLCAVYMPKCENGSIFLPSQEMCRITRGPCKSVEVKHSWPFFLRCENKKLFPPRCKNPLQEVKFNTSYKCISPLVETDNPVNRFHEVEGCGIQCQNPFFTEEEHNSTHHYICILASVCLVLNLISVVTFIRSWKASNRYPGIIIFYINLSIAIASFGWLIQFFPGAREGIVCLNDGTLRLHQPRSSLDLCCISFLLTYPSLMAAIVWCVILTYAWHSVFKQSGAPVDVLKKKVAYFHISAWCIPGVLTVTIMAMSEVDGDSMSGICFVGYNNINMRIFFLLLPIGIATVIGGVFLALVLYTLIKVKLNGANMQVKKIRQMIFKIGSFTALVVLFIICTFACHAYDFSYRKEWDDSLREYIICLAINSAQSLSIMGESANMKCELKSKPNISVVRLHLFCFFGFGIMMSMWVWTRESLESWKRFFYGLCEPAEKDALKLKRHQIIAKAFPRRHDINQGHLSFSLNSTHEDPLGMNLDGNSVASRDISSSWAAALPQFLMRRNAVTGINSFLPRHYSSVSDVSHHISVDSFNQPNLDSLSMQISEQEFVAHALRHQRRKTRKERERYLRANRIAPWFPGGRRGSDTSLHSSMMSASIAAAAAAKHAALGAKVTKATSTGDLGADVILAGSSVLPPMLMRGPPHRSTISREPVNPPFTHGMTDNSHRLGNRNISSALGSTNASRRLTPNPLASAAIPNPLIGMSRPPVFPQNYNFMNSMPFAYLGGGVYPSYNGIFPGYPSAADFMYHSYNSMPYTPFGDFQNTDPVLNQYQEPLLPMEPREDSASEARYFPIIMSESEYTDTGFRSYDESQLFSAQRFIPEQVINHPVQVKLSEMHQLKSGLEPQECAKTQFLKRMGSFNSKTVTAKSPHPPSGKNSPHSEAPPPSLAQSTKSLNEDELDDVFEDSQNGNDVSCVSLPQTSETETLLGKLKSKFKRATSQNIQDQEMLELSNKPCDNSVEQVPSADVKNRPASRRNTPNEKLLASSEGTSLITVNETGENVSR